MNSITSVSSSVSQQTIAALQAKLLHDSPPENGQNRQISSDYTALSVAIKSGDVSEAQTDLARLNLDSQITTPQLNELA